MTVAMGDAMQELACMRLFRIDRGLVGVTRVEEGVLALSRVV